MTTQLIRRDMEVFSLKPVLGISGDGILTLINTNETANPDGDENNTGNEELEKIITPTPAEKNEQEQEKTTKKIIEKIREESNEEGIGNEQEPMK